MMADYNCDRLRTLIPRSTAVHLHSTMALPTITSPNSTLILLSNSITALTLTPQPPFNMCITALPNNIMIFAHSTTALPPISIMIHTFVLSVITIRFHTTRPHIRWLNSPSFIKTSSDPLRSEVRCSLRFM